MRGPPCFGVMESCLIGFGNGLLLLIYLCILSISLFIACFIDYYENAMFIRPLTCMYSPLETPMFIWTHIYCSHFSLAIMYIMNLMHVYLT